MTEFRRQSTLSIYDSQPCQRIEWERHGGRRLRPLPVDLGAQGVHLPQATLEVRRYVAVADQLGVAGLDVLPVGPGVDLLDGGEVLQRRAVAAVAHLTRKGEVFPAVPGSPAASRTVRLMASPVAARGGSSGRKHRHAGATYRAPGGSTIYKDTANKAVCLLTDDRNQVSGNAGRRLRDHVGEAACNARQILAARSHPSTLACSTGSWRRPVCVTFANQIPTQDTSLCRREGNAGPTARRSDRRAWRRRQGGC